MASCILLLFLLNIFLLIHHIFVNSQTKWNIEDNEDCEVGAEQWKLIAWYFKRVSYIEVTHIIRKEQKYRRASRFASYVVKNLYDYTHIEYQTFTLDYSYQDDGIPHLQIYEWHTDQTSDTLLLNGTKHNIPWIEDTILTIKNRITAKNRVREDEPDFGSIVLAENIQIMDHYLNGINRHPFKAKRAHYVLLVYKQVDRLTWDNWASSVMAKLWKHHGILNAIVLSSCSRNNVGYYDPYINLAPLNLSNVDPWGIFRCVPIRLLDLDDDWILRKDTSLNSFPLNITVFYRYPTLVPEQSIPPSFLQTHYARGSKYSNGLAGFDGFVLGNLADALKFNINILLPEDTYGRKLPNKTFTGAIGDILANRADASFNARFLIEYDTSDIEFMFPVIADKLCVIAPAAEKIPQWTAIFKCFDVYVWSSFALVTCICGGFWFMLKVWRSTTIKRRKINSKPIDGVIFAQEMPKFQTVLVRTWMIMLGVTTEMPSKSKERLFIAACLSANLIIFGTFQGSLYTSFSTISYYKNIDTLADLDKSGLPIVASSQSLKYLFGSKETDSTLLKSLNKKYKIYEINAILRAAFDRDMCSVERYSDIHIIIKTNYQRSDGSALLHVIKECPRDYFLSYIVPKGWPLLPRFNNILKKYSEGGFLDLWYQQTENAFIMNALYSNPIYITKNKKQAFTLTDMQTAFYILVLGYILCCIVFIVEVFILPPKKKKQKM